MNLVLSGPIDPTLLNLAVARAKPREVIRLHDRAQRLVGADDTPAARADIEALCDQARVDHAFVEEGLRFSDFKLLAMDMDSTLITIECIDEIADFAGKKAEVAAITEAAMRGEMDFAESLRRRVALLAGTNTSALAEIFHTRVTFSPGGERLVSAAKQSNIYTALISGGFQYFAHKVQARLGICASFANNLEVESETLTGMLTEKIIDAGEKARIVKLLMKEQGVNSAETLVIGDGANDIPMMQAADHSIAYLAKPIAKKAATHAITYGSLATTLDYFCPDDPLSR